MSRSEMRTVDLPIGITPHAMSLIPKVATFGGSQANPLGIEETLIIDSSDGISSSTEGAGAGSVFAGGTGAGVLENQPDACGAGGADVVTAGLENQPDAATCGAGDVVVVARVFARGFATTVSVGTDSVVTASEDVGAVVTGAFRANIFF
jgi:hypothetical protein